MIGALILMSAVTGANAAPIRLVSEPVAGGIRLQVVGASDLPVEAAYSLEVTSGAASRNRSLQRGTARLAPGVPAILVTLTLGDAAGWTAVLKVTPETGAPYEQTQSADQP